MLVACITGLARSWALQRRERECWQVLVYYDVAGMTYAELAAAISPMESDRRPVEEKYERPVGLPLAQQQYSASNLRKLRDEGLRLCVQFLSRSPEAVLQDVSRFSEGEQGAEALAPRRDLLVISVPPSLSRSVKGELIELHSELCSIAQALPHLEPIEIDKIDRTAESDALQSPGLEEIHQQLLALRPALRRYASYPPYLGHADRLRGLIRELELTERTTRLAALIAEVLGLSRDIQ